MRNTSRRVVVISKLMSQRLPYSGPDWVGNGSWFARHDVVDRTAMTTMQQDGIPNKETFEYFVQQYMGGEKSELRLSNVGLEDRRTGLRMLLYLSLDGHIAALVDRAYAPFLNERMYIGAGYAAIADDPENPSVLICTYKIIWDADQKPFIYDLGAFLDYANAQMAPATAVAI